MSEIKGAGGLSSVDKEGVLYGRPLRLFQNDYTLLALNLKELCF